MGAGRTELAMSIFGKSYGTNISGQLFIEGKEVHLNTVHDAISHKIAYEMCIRDRTDATQRFPGKSGL